MIDSRRALLPVVLFTFLPLTSLPPTGASGQEPIPDRADAGPSSASEVTGGLAAFGDRVVGTWEASDSRHVLTWGVGRRLVKSASYQRDGDDWELVSEGFWYWDPSEAVIRGRTIAVGMGIDLFEYETRVEGDVVVHDLVAHGEIAGRFVERWTFDDGGYTWTLEQDGVRLMGGSYRKVR